ncbi:MULTISPECIES: NADH-quinone oxidoreductase subunit L [Providencia]|jgi:NADH-quinone oxidoreductase subunit L|uniref:NADH-quinone oxidoreductase subunit L n=1 Tax=Providencia alcalifaciens TaxID=126385 RepID=A0A4R3NVP5_9GAMM|nr:MULTISPECIES: NADH-quinone oxidoreductase subunit L [Providencia]ETS99923.1 NADH-quinone oxidoreductase subunit L [Providencia alcalifaciens PAL-3]EUD00695.1 NADH-quinone oxidoreductase subunit L [Providencia alcalifaciens PAL-1]MBC5790950.1 NADH-quinone oxidoreductase subunit L [Providencia sp. JUb39]MBG5882564.1 NADH-quinone oxidoreductase subunit L [Providencia alcalifaciens]MTB44470.1 NADH-quinone oxidoreductase subunit L [Providencia sp. wls1950]
MNLLYLTILFPLLGSVLLAFSRGRWSENVSAIIGAGSVGLAALVAFYAGSEFLAQPVLANGGYEPYPQMLWTWMSVGNFTIPFSLSLDGLSLTMLGVVTGVGFLIHVYASWYMRGEEGYSRFFTYTNLFIASMVVLVLADNMMLMYLGWEGVGLCSYLLIGFYYTNPENGKAAMKAFFVTRIGDVFLAIGMFILYNELGTLNFSEMAQRATQLSPEGLSMLNWATLMLLGGAVGKSAQLPLQTWLADAMAGPTPVSALIHAATMVTAGVYLIARTHGLFLLTPDILHLVGVVGAVTLLFAGFAALVQTDIKRVLAYSTMSQIGYMFLALGVQAWDAAIFHLMTHAFFKALLFLSAGSVIIACHHEQNIFKMGGLRKQIPFVYIVMLIGGSALAALPLFTSGFYSKDAILWGAKVDGQTVLLWAGIIGALMTAIYTFRMIFIVFHGEAKIKAHKVKGITHTVPLAILAILATFVGAMIHQPLEGVFPAKPMEAEDGKLFIEAISGGFAIAGLLIATFLYLFRRSIVDAIAKTAIGRFFSTWWYHAWGFDWLYDVIFVKPFKGIAWLLESDPINSLMNIPAHLSRWANKGLAVSENGQIRWYVASLGLGAVLILALLLLV